MKKCRIEKQEDRMLLMSEDTVIATVGIGPEDCNTVESAQETLIDLAHCYGFNQVKCSNFEVNLNL